MTLRSFIAICLAFVLTLTGQSMAIARGASPAMGQMVLCVGEGAMVVYVDQSGAPTSAPHICPDCTLALLDAVLPDVTRIGTQTPLVVAAQTHACAAGSDDFPLSYMCRAPPVFL